MSTVIIYGTTSCPYTKQAREDYESKGYEVDFRDVEEDRTLIHEMMEKSKGRRQVPVIIQDSKVTIGYGGT